MANPAFHPHPNNMADSGSEIINFIVNDISAYDYIPAKANLSYLAKKHAPVKGDYLPGNPRKPTSKSLVSIY